MATNFEALGQEIGQLVQRKQDEYGDSHSKSLEVLRILYQDGKIPVDQGALTLIRVIDKLFRIANGNKGNEDAWTDVAGYALLMISRNRTERLEQYAMVRDYYAKFDDKQQKWCADENNAEWNVLAVPVGHQKQGRKKGSKK